VKPVTLEAHELIRGERAKHYGPPHDNFEIISRFWDIYVCAYIKKLLRENDADENVVRVFEREAVIDENDVCNLMSLLKVAREASGGGYHRDSTVDTVGYQGIKEVLHDYSREQFIEEMS